jgi:hypothetical protein
MFTQGTVANCGKDCPAKSDLLLRFQRVMTSFSQPSPYVKENIFLLQLKTYVYQADLFDASGLTAPLMPCVSPCHRR